MDLHQLPGPLYSSPQPYSVTAGGLGQDPSSCSADDKNDWKTDVYFTRSGQKYTPLFLSSTWANICLRDPSTCSCYHIFYIMQLHFRNGGFKTANTGFFSDWNFAIWKTSKSKQSWLTHDLVSTLVYTGVYKAIQWQHWVGMRWLWTKKNAVAASRRLH